MIKFSRCEILILIILAAVIAFTRFAIIVGPLRVEISNEVDYEISNNIHTIYDKDINELLSHYEDADVISSINLIKTEGN